MKATGVANAGSSHQFYTAAVGFLSRDLPEPVEVKKMKGLVQTAGGEWVQAEAMQK
jgi:hypothetical protein